MSGLGVVLSGGGARGAYEAGVLQFAFADLPKKLGRTPDVRVICGASVGAVNGTFLASAIEAPDRGVRRLVDLWRQLSLDQVLAFGVREATGLHRVLLGGKRPAGLFGAVRLGDLVRNSGNWRQLRYNIRKGRLTALTVTTTDVATGHPVVFVDRAPGVVLPTTLPAQVVVSAAHIGPHHVLASAAIPLVFPPVAIGGRLHCDGGLRLNTPMSPALHLGMDRLLVVGVSTPHGVGSPSLEVGRFPGASFLLGKVLNAFLLDHVNSDLGELNRVNRVIEDGETAFGPDFIDRVNAITRLRGGFPRRRVAVSALRPSVDIGRTASEYLQSHRARFGRVLGRAFLRLLDVGVGADADIASYLLFDGEFARELIEMGRRDAENARDELEALLFDPSESALPHSEAPLGQAVNENS